MNNPPTDLILRSTQVREAVLGAVVGRLRVVDADPDDGFRFTVDDARFKVTASGKLKLKPGETLDFEAEPSLALTVTVTDAAGLSFAKTFAIDVADGAPEIDLVGLDGPLQGDRLAFSHLETTDGRIDKSTATVRIVNRGTDTLTLGDLDLSGPFALLDPAQSGAAIAAGQSLDVTIRFARSLYDPATEPDIFTGRLDVLSDDGDEPLLSIDLAGFWQAQPEKGQEPSVNEVWEVFGFGNRLDVGDLDNFDIVETVPGPDAAEVLVPYWRLADGVAEATVTWIASYHGKPPTSIALHAPGDAAARVTLLTQGPNQNQTVLPTTTGGVLPTATIDNALIPNGWDGDEVFGLFIQDESSDPTLNLPGPGTPPDPDASRGHFVRVFQALDAEGKAIADTWLVIEDYNSKSINYDYNDNMFLLRGLTPATDLVVA